MAASKTIGGINVTISASTQKFQAGLTKARKLLIGFTSSIKNTIFSVKGLTAALTGAAGVAGFTVMTKNAFAAVDAMGKLSDKLGVSTKHLAGLQLAADEAGVSEELLERALVKLSTVTGQSGDRALRNWIENTSRLGTQQEKLAAAVEMFGARGSDMVRFLKGGTAALDDAQRAAESFGLSLTRSAVAGVERAMDSIGRLKKAIGGVFAQASIVIAPYIDVLTGRLTQFLTDGGRVQKLGAAIGGAIIAGIGKIGDMVQRLVDAGLRFFGDAKGLSDWWKKQFEAPFELTGGGVAGWLGFKPGGSPGTSGSVGGVATNTFSVWLRDSVDAVMNDIDRSMKTTSGPDFSKPKSLASRGRAGSVSLLGQVVGTPQGTGRDAMGLKAAASFMGAKGSVQSVLAALLGGKGSVNLDAFAPKPRDGMSPPLTLAESGSVESYRQQAAIRRQSVNMAAKQTKLQAAMLAALNKIEKKVAPVGAANL